MTKSIITSFGVEGIKVDLKKAREIHIPKKIEKDFASLTTEQEKALTKYLGRKKLDRGKVVLLFPREPSPDCFTDQFRAGVSAFKSY